MKNLSTTSAAVDTTAAAVDTAAAAADLKTLIHDHDQFFDKLIELIPAKFYLPTDEDSKPWFQGLSKGKKASLKQQTRENIKKSRRDRLDPEKAQTTTLDLLKKIVSRNEDSDEEQEEIEIIVKPVNKSVSYEELQRRLHSWKAATEKAMEVKVHDDPMLLKSAGKWKEREEIVEKMREEKQAKRRGNVEERASQKKMRKKLMRPGFEGRKEGYIGGKGD